MYKKFFQYGELIAVVVLLVCSIVVWSEVAAIERPLTVAFLDVGQGDAIFIESPVGNQVLVDAGFGPQVLRELGEVMPAHDRSIDVLIATHADADHVGGFPDVLSRFEVSAVVEGGSVSESGLYETFADLAVEEGALRKTVGRGSVIDLGGGAFLQILFPDREAGLWEDNTASVVMRLVYGETSFLLTGDAPKSVEGYILSLDGEYLRSDVLKAGHHGSRTSTGEMFVDAVDPAYAILSYECDNRYGHPHADVLDVLRREAAEILSTCEDGTIVFESDGTNVSIK